MKLSIEAEDAIIGIICGVLLLGFTGTFFTLKLSNIFYVIAFIIFIVFILLDFINEFRWIASHFKIVLLSMAHNIIDLIISLGYISYFTGFNIPLITSRILPYLQNQEITKWMGVFLAVSNAVWLVTLPLWE